MHRSVITQQPALERVPMPAILPPPRLSAALASQRKGPSRQLRAFIGRAGGCMARRRSHSSSRNSTS